MKMRRQFMGLALIAAVSASTGYVVAALAADAQPVRIALTATKFAFSSKEIVVRKGRPVTLVLTSPDFVHGFSVPDFKLRRDVPPGKTVEVTFTPDRAGRFIFLCDNFCGEGHDQMAGLLVVTDD
jgi:cytochrome c oxidase subunit II